MKCNHANGLNHQTQASNANTQRNLSTQALMGATRLASLTKAKVISCIDIAFSRREMRRPH